jgi:hypothetical protein
MAGKKILLGMLESGHVKTGASFFSHPTWVECNGGDRENFITMEMKTVFKSRLRGPTSLFCDHHHHSK